jgi:cytochrome oxidase Cu insertion factor (SCO1/SenC/PrrC family)
VAGGPPRRLPRGQGRRLAAGGCAAWLLLAGAAAGQPPARGDEAGEPSAHALMDDLMWGRGPIGGPLGGLTDHTGARRPEASFLGRPALLYFGYTHCADVCPTDLQAIAAAADLLGGDAEGPPQMLFVTLEPERDRAERLADYVALFHPRLVGLTGTPADIRRVARDHKVYVRRMEPPDASDYLLDHSAFIYLRDADGRHLGFFPPGTPAERIAAAVRMRLGGHAPAPR